MGNFARRHWKYFGRGYESRWRRHEEKQTDVGIAAYAIRDAFRDLFDRALIISVDTDMIPLFDILTSEFPNKIITCVAPPQRSHHQTLINASSNIDTIKVSQIEKSLLAARVRNGGQVVAKRPKEYDPPI